MELYVKIIMSLQTFIGPEGNLLSTTEQQCHRLQLQQPVLTNKQLGALKKLDHRGWKSRVIDTTYDRPATGDKALGEAALAEALGDLGVPERQRRMRVRQLWSWLYSHGATDFDAMTDIGKEPRARLAEAD